MTPIADRPVVVLDANVLFPFRTRDILLRFHHAGLFQARWTARILDEWTRSLLGWKPHLERSVRSQRRAMDKHFDDAPVTGYEPLVEALDLPDADDRHVLAAAIRCGAQYVVTDNLADFPVDLNTIRAWLGHASLDTTSVYAEIDIERKAKAVALFDSAEPARSRSYRDNRGLLAYLQSL